MGDESTRVTLFLKEASHELKLHLYWPRPKQLPMRLLILGLILSLRRETRRLEKPNATRVRDNGKEVTLANILEELILKEDAHLSRKGVGHFSRAFLLGPFPLELHKLIYSVVM